MSMQVLYNFLFMLGIALKKKKRKEWWNSLKNGMLTLSALKTPQIFSPTAILRFALDILQKNQFFRLLCWLQLMFSIICSQSQFFSVYRGTLKILPFSENCVFDCINKLCRHPVDPILWGFCRTQLKCLGWQTNKQAYICLIAAPNNK